MTDAALTNASSYAQVRIREPAGERIFGEATTVGGVGADVVVPGAGRGVAMRIVRRKAVWIAEPFGDAEVRFDGRALTGARDLRRQDVIALGDAQIIVTDVSRTLLRIDVCHLVGNATVPPAGTISALALTDGDVDLEIHAPAAPPAPPPDPEAIESESRRLRRLWKTATAAAITLLIVLAVVSQLHSVALDIEPGDARVRVPGTLLAMQMGSKLFVLTGSHVVRAEHAGYTPAQAQVTVRGDARARVFLRLAKLPGTLQIDTGGIAATVSVDGAEAGRVPGAIVMPAGEHTVAIRAPRHVDYIATIEIQGALVRQSLKAALQPSWGTMQISTVPAGAHVSVDGVDSGVAPTVVDAPSGVRRVRISAANLKAWESSVVLKAGEALAIGPVTLGEPDARLGLTSVPAGAEVTVGGVLRGRTPISVDLPAGIQHEVVVNSPGYAPWTQRVFAEAGKSLALHARLEAVGARVTVQGEPDDAQLLIDGIDRGRTPQSLELSATEHRIEVRKERWVTFTGTVTPAQGFDRTIHYRLAPADRSLAPGETAWIAYTQTGYMLRRVPLGTFRLDIERRGAGGPPNEALRLVTLKRPFYFGVAQVTNEQFRRFKPGYGSAAIGRHAADLDGRPVQVTWNDAARYCNWLSEGDSLPPAYEKRGDRYVLRRPVTMGYRLPTEAEWVYGGRFKAAPLGLQDMSGHAPEWVNDYSLLIVDRKPVTDPLGPDDGGRHVALGGNRNSPVVADGRPAWRDAVQDSSALGFRVARYAE